MAAKYKISNYEKMKDDMATVFLQYDQENMIRKFALEYDETYLYVSFFGRKYRINRLTGSVGWSDDAFRTEQMADYNEAMTIYDVLCCSKEACQPANEWINVGSLSGIQGGTLAKGSNFFQDAGTYFDGKTGMLVQACESLGGRRVKKGDVAFELDLFPFLTIALNFWESDEDFPASLQILVDKNILEYMHYETVMFAVTHVLDCLKNKCEKLSSLSGFGENR